VLLLVARSTHAASEISALLTALDARGRRVAVALTFEDKMGPGHADHVQQLKKELGVPVVAVNARAFTTDHGKAVLAALEAAAPLARVRRRLQLREGPRIEPRLTLLEAKHVGPWLSLLALGLMFASPVYVAYAVAESLQPFVDARLIAPTTVALAKLPPIAHALLVGEYGVLTLGWYSFLWAFPVVFLVGVSVAVADESGLKDRITTALDPWLRRIGLSGRDLIPVLTGFGCNVVAVLQTRSCSRCTRASCVSLISFGSACSYQIGASLSVFGAAGHAGLFGPYLLALFLVGAAHTRLWHGALGDKQALAHNDHAFLQWPTLRGSGSRMRAVLQQFLFQAIPAFLIICVVAALLKYTGVLTAISTRMGSTMGLFSLPQEATPAVLLSVLRKDGLLTLHAGSGEMLTQLTALQLFTVVWLASTASACLVTLWTVRRELGARTALKMACRQLATSIVSGYLISRLAVFV